MGDRGLRTIYYRERKHRAHENRVAKWWCAGCGKYHGATVDRIRTLDGIVMCFHQYNKLMDAEKGRNDGAR